MNLFCKEFLGFFFGFKMNYEFLHGISDEMAREGFFSFFLHLFNGCLACSLIRKVRTFYGKIEWVLHIKYRVIICAA